MSMSSGSRLTPSQRHNAELMFEQGWIPFRVGPGRMQRNIPMWTLVKLGLAEFDWGPRGSWLKTYSFLPVWSDPIC